MTQLKLAQQRVQFSNADMISVKSPCPHIWYNSKLNDVLDIFDAYTDILYALDDAKRLRIFIWQGGEFDE